MEAIPYIIYVETKDHLLEDIPELISKRIVETTESVEIENNKIIISNVLIAKCSKCSCELKSIPVINHNTLHSKQHMYRSKLRFNS